MQTVSSINSLIPPYRNKQLHLQTLIKPRIKPIHSYAQKQLSTDKYQATLMSSKNLQRLDSLHQQEKLQSFIQKKLSDNLILKNTFQSTFGAYHESPSSSFNRSELFGRNVELDFLGERNQRGTFTRSGASKKNYISYLASARALLNENKENFNLNKDTEVINCYIRDDKFENSIKVINKNTLDSYKSSKNAPSNKSQKSKRPQSFLKSEQTSISFSNYSNKNQFENVRFFHP